jgi:hypothetical protein
MTPQNLQEAYARANAVIEGIKRPSEQNARDVVNIMKHFSTATKKSETKTPEMPDFLKGLFR